MTNNEYPSDAVKPLRILYMGTPEFAAVSLQYLVEQGYQVVGVVCRADKPRDRGMQLTPPPVKVTALQAELPVWQPETLRDGALLPVLEETKPDLIAVVAYGRILPSYVLDYPKYGCINLHGSLLPAYRGAAPIQRAVMNGDRTTGLTTMYLSEGMDEGDMILRLETEIGPDETAGALTERLAALGGPLLAETIDRIAAGTAPRVPQDPAQATYAAMLEKAEGKVDFTAAAQKIYDTYRGLTPAFSTSTMFRGKSVKLTGIARDESGERPEGEPGQVIRCTKSGILVRCGDGCCLWLTELAPEGKRAMAAADFVNGRAVRPGDRFGA